MQASDALCDVPQAAHTQRYLTWFTSAALGAAAADGNTGTSAIRSLSVVSAAVLRPAVISAS